MRARNAAEDRASPLRQDAIAEKNEVRDHKAGVDSGCRSDRLDRAWSDAALQLRCPMNQLLGIR
jgi:hypothetical protein